MTISEYAVSVSNSIIQWRKEELLRALSEHGNDADAAVDALYDQFFDDDAITGGTTGTFFALSSDAAKALGFDLPEVCAALVGDGAYTDADIGSLIRHGSFEGLDVAARQLVLRKAIMASLVRLGLRL